MTQITMAETQLNDVWAASVVVKTVLRKRFCYLDLIKLAKQQCCCQQVFHLSSLSNEINMPNKKQLFLC